MDSRRRGNYEVGGRTDEMGCVYAGGWRQAAALRGSPTTGLRPRIGVRGMLLIAGVTSWESVFVAIAHAGCRRHAKGMKSRSCGLVQRIGAADSATPHPDPSGGQAPALHFLIPPSTIGLQIGTFRRWRAGIEVDWRAHPGSESGMCFRSNRSCLLSPAHQGMKVNAGYPLGSRPGVGGMPSSAGITRWGPEWRVGRL